MNSFALVAGTRFCWWRERPWRTENPVTSISLGTLAFWRNPGFPSKGLFAEQCGMQAKMSSWFLCALWLSPLRPLLTAGENSGCLCATGRRSQGGVLQLCDFPGDENDISSPCRTMDERPKQLSHQSPPWQQLYQAYRARVQGCLEECRLKGSRIIKGHPGPGTPCQTGS